MNKTDIHSASSLIFIKGFFAIFSKLTCIKFEKYALLKHLQSARFILGELVIRGCKTRMSFSALLSQEEEDLQAEDILRLVGTAQIQKRRKRLKAFEL